MKKDQSGEEEEEEDYSTKEKRSEEGGSFKKKAKGKEKKNKMISIARRQITSMVRIKAEGEDNANNGWRGGGRKQQWS